MLADSKRKQQNNQVQFENNSRKNQGQFANVCAAPALNVSTSLANMCCKALDCITKSAHRGQSGICKILKL